MIWILLAGGAVLALASRKPGKSGAGPSASTMSNSQDAGIISPGLTLPVYGPWINWVLTCISDGKSASGWLYYWGGPTASGCPSAAFLPPTPGTCPSLWFADCSGGTWSFLIIAGIISSDTPRFTSLIAAPGGKWGRYRLVAVPPDEIRPGDCVEYDGHITCVVGGSGLTATVLSMSGGGRSDFGTNLNARAKLMHANYRTIKQILRFVPA